MKKKRILIIISSFNIGGTIVSLNSLLSKLDSRRVEVDIFARLKQGDYMGKLPNCRLLDENLWMSHSIYYKSAIIRYLNFLLLCIRKAFEYIGIDLSVIYNYIGGKQVETDKYDAIVAYDETLPRYVSYMPAKKRISWINCDYRRHAQGKDESKYYDKIDKVVCVAESMRKVFVDIYPQYAAKTVAIHNVINVEDIVEKSKSPIDDNRFSTECFTIVSCGRLDPVKQFALIPEIASKVKSLSQKTFKWYIIGEGEDRGSIESSIERYGMQDVVILLGKKPNPYPYMAKANIYVCTSYSEAHPLVVNEARALRVPVLCNKFESAYESVEDGRDGYIIPIESMTETIAEMMEKPLVIEKCYLDNEETLQKIYNIL